MHVLIQIDAKLPVQLYGGTERVMWYLAEALTSLGHRVSLLCRAGSHCHFADVVVYNPGIPVTKQIPEGVDIVHLNNGVPDDFRQPDAPPYIVTFHGNDVTRPLDPHAVFVSRNHAMRFGSDSYVYNGLKWDDYHLKGILSVNELSLPREHYHFLGKAAWRVKNVRGAIRIARQIPGGRIDILGGTRLNLKMGFRFTLTPRARFRGMVGGEEKLRELYGSKGLIFPVKWDEPFGLAITESLFCGAPVFGTPRGSLPELVIPDVGFLSESETELAQHIADFGDSYSPQICREYAADNFNAVTMARRYLLKYEEALNNSTFASKSRGL